MQLKTARVKADAHEAHTANAVKVTPGHGVAGRHATRRVARRAFRKQRPRHVRPNVSRRLHPLEVSDAKLEALANAMLDANPGDPQGNNPNIPAGFTYFGQFVDHDITLDLTSLGDKEKDPLGIENFRTPSVDLDCVYGLGPDGSPHLYARNPAAGNKHGPKLLIGKNITVPFGNVTGDFRNDLPRSPEGFALIGDHRNDENLLVAQTHLTMLKFHNAVCDMLSNGRQSAARHLQARRAGSSRGTISGSCCTTGSSGSPKKASSKRSCTTAANSTVSRRCPTCRSNSRRRPTGSATAWFASATAHNKVFPAADFQLFFDFSGLSGGIIGDLAPNPPTAPTPVPVLPSNWIIDWRRFYDLGASGGAAVTINYLAQARPVPGQVAAHAARRRRQSRIPQSQTRR